MLAPNRKSSNAIYFHFKGSEIIVSPHVVFVFGDHNHLKGVDVLHVFKNTNTKKINN